MNPYERNIFLFHALTFIHAFTFSWAVIHILFLQQLGFSFSQIGWIFSAVGATYIIAEILTGMYADMYSRKSSIILSSIIYSVGVSAYMFFSSFWVLLIASSLFALATSFISGTFDATIFESLKKLKRAKEYKKVLSQNQFIFIALGVLTNLLIPIIFEYNSRLPFYIAGSMSVFAIVLSFFFTDTNKKRNKHFLLHLKTSLHVVLHSQNLRWLILFAASLSITIAFFGDVLNQPFVKENTSLLLYGIIFSLATIVQSLVVWRVPVIIEYLRERHIFFFLVAAVPIGLLLLLIPSTVTLVFFMGLFWSLGTFRYIFFSDEINSLVKQDSERATIHSISSMADAFVYMITVPLLSWGITFLTLSQSIILLAIIAVVVPGFVLFFKPNSI